MPAEAPLARPIQNLRAPYRDPVAPPLAPAQGVRLWRLVVFVPAILTTLVLVRAFLNRFGSDGLNSLEVVLIALIAATFFWISLSVSTATAGIFTVLRARRQRFRPARSARPMRVALLVPIYNEVPWDVFGNMAAMLHELETHSGGHHFSVFMLSDTRDEAIAAQEVEAVRALRVYLPGASDIWYRRRADNTDRKVGNLSDWIERFGGAHESMLVLDADSLMSAHAIVALVDEMSADPSSGLIQSFPQLIGAQSLFGRVQQFSSAIYGALLAEGLAKWSDREGNYWGHNAIMRTAAFASCAGLPRLGTHDGAGRLILSHDFVEAGLLRRAGWGVRFVPEIKGSFEETPATLIDYVIRDRRWCQGNLQHLRILRTSGMHTISRFHLFQGAMSYLVSPIWFLLLTCWAVLGTSESRNVITYFSDINPLRPTWPVMSKTDNVLILLFMYGMLLAPKVMGMVTFAFSGLTMRRLGGGWQFALSFLTEVSASIAFAPVLMVQQMIAVVRVGLGAHQSWTPQQRSGGHYTLPVLLKFHLVETITGGLLVAGIATGIVSLWLVPIAASLVAAVPLSAVSGVNLSRHGWARQNLGTPHEFDEPDIIRLSKVYRARLRETLEHRSSDLPIAAE